MLSKVITTIYLLSIFCIQTIGQQENQMNCCIKY
jgi:hypothetical protein